MKNIKKVAISVVEKSADSDMLSESFDDSSMIDISSQIKNN
jgi:hypothetical protein